MHFAPSLVELNAAVTSPDEAISAAGRMLVEEECATPDYIDAMLTAFREMGPYDPVHIVIVLTRADDGSHITMLPSYSLPASSTSGWVAVHSANRSVTYRRLTSKPT